MNLLDIAKNKYWIDENNDGKNDKYDYGENGDGTKDTDGDGKFDIDCSHLVNDVLREAGYKLPKDNITTDRMTCSKYYYKATDDIKAGDVVLFNGHVGIVVSYDPITKTGKFFGSQGKTGPAETTFSTNPAAIDPKTGKPYYWGGTKKFTNFLRPEPITQPSLPNKPKIPGKVTHRDPLILDIDGDGIHALGLTAGIHFDYDGNGFKELTGWVAPGDGMLMLDRDTDGILGNGSELFGDFTPLANGMNALNGFQALAQYDANGDGKIDASDPVWSQLKVWQHDPEATDLGDPDSSGILSTLDEIGIKAIYLDSTIINRTDDAGNTEIRSGHFEWTDNRQSTISEYRLQRDTSNAIATEYLEVLPDIETLPDLQGYGNVYSLQQAMARDASGQLKSLVESFIAEMNPANRATILDQIIFKWTGTDAIATNARGPFMDGRKVVALEKFYGDSPRNPDPGLATLWKDTYHELFEIFYSNLMSQTHLKNLFDKIDYAFDEISQKIKGDLSAVVTDIQAALAGDPDQGKALLSEFSRTLRGFGAQEMVNYLSFRETFIMQDESLGWVIDAGGLPVIDGIGQGSAPLSQHVIGMYTADAVKGSLTEGDGYINGLAGSDVVYGTSRHETLINSTGDSILVAGAGNDRIWAGTGNDILDGGAGNDVLEGESGNDTYIFRLGSGQDKIIDTDPTEGNTDTIWIGSNLTPDDIALRRSGNNLIVKINNTTDTLTVQDFFKNESPLNRIEQIQFMDGTVWNMDEMYYRVLPLPTETDDIIYGSSGDDILHGLGGNDAIYGLAGNDTLFGDADGDILYGGTGEDTIDSGEGADVLDGGTGNDALFGDAGNDKLNGGTGEDLIDGGEGSDILDGGTGNDTYIFNRGSGQDVINDTETTAWNIDTVIFGANISPSDIKIERSGSEDIKLSIIGTPDSILLKNCILNNRKDYRSVIEQYKFADGTVWSADTIKEFILTGTDDNNTIWGFSDHDIIHGMAGNDGLYGREGSDILDGGTGNDALYGETGSDTYIFGRGSGQDIIYERDATPGNTDTILMAANVLPDDVKLIRPIYSDDLMLLIKDTNDTIKVREWFFDESGEWQVERIQFADGTVWDVDTIKAKVLLGTDDPDELKGYSTNDNIVGYDGNDVLYGRNGDDLLSGGAGNDRIYGEGGNDTLVGDEGNDILDGGAGDDILAGEAGVDRLYGGSGNDILSGDEGDDILEGGEGSDTFIFRTGSGQDVIRSYDSEASSIDTIFIEDGITTDVILIRRNVNDLVVINRDTGDSMRVENWFTEGKEAEKIDKVQFSDGTVWDVAMLKELALAGTQEADNLTGYATDDIMDGKEGNDLLYGGAGNDTYVFGRGYGQDILIDNDSFAGNIDTILFNSDVLPEDVEFKRVDSDLHISITGTDDSLTVKNWFIGDLYKVEQIRFADNTIWDVATIETSINQPTDTDDYITGTPGNDAIDGGGGNDIILGQEGNDILYGGSGDDTLKGNDGDDQLFGGEGNDSLQGESSYGMDPGFIYGRNLFDGGPGDDTINAGQGENTIMFNRGSGFDTIYSHFIDPTEPSATSDTIIFGEGIKPEDLLIQMNISYSDIGFGEVITELNLAIGIGNNDGMFISAFGESGGGGGEFYGPYDEANGFTSSDLAIKRFVFADGQELTIEDIAARADGGVIGEQYGTSGDDFLRGSITNDFIYANDGNDRVEALDRSDIVYTGSGDDAVSGGAGDDELYGGEGNDVIAGGPGGDYINGETGNDVYAFNRGDGLDYIENNGSWSDGDIDTISFGADISPQDIKGYLDEYGDLMLRVGESTDEIWTTYYQDTDLAPHQSSISRVQFIDVNGNARIFDLIGIVESLKNDLIQAYNNGDDPVSLFTDTTSGFELTGTVGAAGGDYAAAYAQTGDLFALPATYTGSDSDDIINGRAGDDTIEAGNGNNIVNAGNGNNAITAGYGNDRITSGSGNDVIYDEGGQNVINAGAGNDWIIGGEDADIIEAGDGDDIMEGRGGDDSLSGGSGDDTYYFSSGDGTLTINDLADVTGGNRIVFGEQITPDDLKLIAGNGSFTIMVGEEGDSITLNNFDPQNAYGIRAVSSYEFDSGEILTYEQLIARGFEITGTETDDLISGTSLNDRIAAFGGDDVIAGGKGNDTIEGGSGNDTYIFNLGDGVDTIRDATALGAGNAVEFGAGITVSGLKLKVEENTLVIEVGQNGDALHLEGFNPDDAYGVHAVDEFKFADGSTLNYADLLGLGFTFSGAPQNDILKGTSADDTFFPGAGNDDIYGGEGNDSYYFNFGDGSDIINDESTPDSPNTLIFGAGITPADIRLSHNPDLKTLIITTGNNTDSISMTGFDAADPYGTHAVEYFQFEGGQILTYGELINRGFDIIGTSEDDTLSGTAATDRITGNSGNDTLSGGAGNDTLIGGFGDDTYLFNQGDGVDLIDDAADASEGNTLVFGEGITLEDMRRSLGFKDGKLIISIGVTGDEVHLTGFDPEMADYGSHAVENFQFADGTLINYEQLVQNTFIVQGDSEDDNLQGTNVTDRLYGYEGSDSLAGGSGDDTLTGGTENDILSGGAGDDTYVFNPGDGIDTIYDVASAGEGNLIYFGEGISRDDLSITREGDILTINVGLQGDAIRLMNFDPAETSGSLTVRTIEFSDGTRMHVTDLLGTEGDDIIITGSGDDSINGRGGNDVITTGAGSDILTGGTGNDILTGGIHNDTYIFNIGDGLDTINDTAAPGEGNRIVFGPGIAPIDITLTIENTTLKINVGSNGDGILLGNFDPNDAASAKVIETFEFENFTEISFADFIERYGIHITGTDGDDIISGTNVNDTISGLAGNDVINGGAGPDIMTGGLGNDSYFAENADDKVIESLNEGDDTVIASIGYSLPENVENLVLSGSDAIDGTGNALNNSITGNSAVNTLYGNEGDDNLSGNSGDDTIYGDDGDDTLSGGEGSDIMTGGAGNDTYVFNIGDGVDTIADTSTLAEGNMILFGEGITASDLTFVRNDGSLTINIGNSGDAINLLNFDQDETAGSLVVRALRFADGSQRNLTYFINRPPVVVNPLADQTTLEDAAFSFTVPGNTFADIDAGDTLTYSATLADGTALPSWLTFDAVTRTFSGIPTNDNVGMLPLKVTATDLSGASVSNDFNVTIVNVNDVPVVVNPLADQTTLEDAAFSFTVPGNTFADIDAGDTLTYSATLADGTALPSWLTFDPVSRTFSGIPTNDNVGTLSLKVTATDAAGASVSNAFNVTVENINDDSVITYGTNGMDFIFTGRENDLIYALGGPDVVYSAEGNDTIYGGDGTDLLFGDGGNDVIYGENGSDALFGGNGNDFLSGGNDGDFLYGGGGDDTLDGGTGADVMMGGNGNDTYYVDNTGDVVMENANEGTDTVNSSITYTLGNNVENLTLTGTSAINGTGNTLNNVLTGNNGINTLTGSGGSDSFKGNGGNDILTGGNGSDTYSFSRTDGKDTITETAGLTGDTDTAKMIDGISTTEPVIVKQNNDLYLFVDADNYMKVTGQFQSANYGVERLEVTDGHYITRQDIDNIVNTMSAINNDAGMDAIQKYNAMRNDQTYINVLSQSWQQG